MSQNAVYEILQDLGGEASGSEITAEARQRYPDKSLHKYTATRLRSLADKEVVEIDTGTGDGHVNHYRIVDDDWDGVSETLANRDFPG